MKIPTAKQYEMNRAVMRENMKIADVARAFATSPSTVRRAMDAVSHFRHAKFTIEVDGGEVNQIIGWLRNGNFTAQELADRIAAQIEGS